MENGRVFALRITSEKNLKNRKNLFIALMNREETYYRVKGCSGKEREEKRQRKGEESKYRENINISKDIE